MEDIKQENYQTTNNEVIQLLEHSYNNIYQYQVCGDISGNGGIFRGDSMVLRCHAPPLAS